MSEWDGSERRDCPGCRNLDVLERRVNDCKDRFEGEISSVHESVARLSGEVHGLRADVHGMSESVSTINASLADIATTLRQLADFPETWSNLKGFMRVTTWLRTNIVTLGIVVVILWYAMSSSIVVDAVREGLK